MNEGSLIYKTIHSEEEPNSENELHHENKSSLEEQNQVLKTN